MNTIRTVIETLMRLIQAEVLENAMLVAPDDMFEVKRTPSLLLQGPTLVENAARRTPGTGILFNVWRVGMSCCLHPALWRIACLHRV